MSQDFIITVREINDPDEEPISLELKSTDTLKMMTEMIQREKMIDNDHEFSLHEECNSDSWAFYKHKPGVFDDELSSNTVSRFFNSHETDIFFCSAPLLPNLIKRSKDIRISNATDDDVRINVSYQARNKTTSKVGGGLDGTTFGANVNTEYADLGMQNVTDWYILNAHMCGYSQEFALQNGHADGAVHVEVVRKETKSELLTAFNVEPEEHWILFNAPGKKVVHGKGHKKGLFVRAIEMWETKRSNCQWVDRDPHKELLMSDTCNVCGDRGQGRTGIF